MKLTEVFEILEQRDPNTLFVVGDSHGAAIQGGNIRNLAKNGVKVEAIGAQTQSVPDNSVVVYSGGANNHADNGNAVVAEINKQISSMRDRGCFVILVLYPMIDIESKKPSAVPNDGRANKGMIVASTKKGETVEVTPQQLADGQANGTLMDTVEDRLQLKYVYRNLGLTNNYNRVREQIRRGNRADETLELKNINPRDPMGIHSTPESYSSIGNSARQMGNTEIQKRKDSEFPIGSDIPAGEEYRSGNFGGMVGDLFGIFGAAFGREEEIPDRDLLIYDKDGNPVDANGNPIDNADQPQGAQVNVGDLSKGLVNYIKTKEGYGIKIDPNDPRSDVRAYDDFGQYSIGFGTRARSNTERLTYEQAERRLMISIDRFRNGVIKLRNQYGYQWNDAAIDAMTSFAYNLGLGAVKQVTNSGTRSNAQIGRKMLEYNKAGGQRLAGLVQRRREESGRFLASQSRQDLAFVPTGSNKDTA